MGGCGMQAEAVARFDLQLLFAVVQKDASGQHIAEFLALVRRDLLAASARTSSVTLYSGVTVKSVMLMDT